MESDFRPGGGNDDDDLSSFATSSDDEERGLGASSHDEVSLSARNKNSEVSEGAGISAGDLNALAAGTEG